IPESEMPRLFERFHRIHGARGRSVEGTGIGLALVHELVRLHGGTVRADSQEGQGSTFTVRLPPGKAPPPAPRIDEAPPLAEPSSLGASFVEEALRWLPSDDSPPEQPPPAASPG